jgi:hypothetical protein
MPSFLERKDDDQRQGLVRYPDCDDPTGIKEFDLDQELRGVLQKARKCGVNDKTFISAMKSVVLDLEVESMMCGGSPSDAAESEEGIFLSYLIPCTFRL